MIRIIQGDCTDVLRTLEPDSVHAVVTDPPYHLTTNKPGGTGIASLNVDSPAGRSRIGTGFMGKAWDGGDIAFRPDTWRLVFDAMKPGAYLVAFGGTRTYHRMACAIEDAGFEIRDTLCWLYGSGFPKSHNPGEQMDREMWDETEWERGERSHRSVYWGRFGTALKPAFEPIILARKPLIGTVVANVLQHGTGAINIDASRVACAPGDKGEWPITDRRHNDVTWTVAPVPTDQSTGRWPANVMHDGSEEVEAAFAEQSARMGMHSAGSAQPKQSKWDCAKTEGWGNIGAGPSGARVGDSGTASRFFYSSKADKGDRADSRHPTVKPVDLMRWLVRLVTPPGGTILDPFAGSGTTGEAAMLEGFDCIMIERDPQSVADIRHRIKRWSGDDTPLFAGVAAE